MARDVNYGADDGKGPAKGLMWLPVRTARTDLLLCVLGAGAGARADAGAGAGTGTDADCSICCCRCRRKQMSPPTMPAVQIMMRSMQIFVMLLVMLHTLISLTSGGGLLTALSVGLATAGAANNIEMNHMIIEDGP